MTRTPFIYCHNLPSREAAEEAICDLFAEGEIDRADKPRARRYTRRDGQQSWGVELSR